jgi:hypothetical protein
MNANCNSKNRRLLEQRLAALRSKEKSQLITDVCRILYGTDLNSENEWTETTIEDVAEQIDLHLELRWTRQ